MSDKNHRSHRHSFFCTVQPMILVILIFGLYLLTSMVCVTVLILKGVTAEKTGITEAMLLAIYASPMTGAISALGALLAVQKMSGGSVGEVTDVKVVNARDERVPTDPAEPNPGD